MGIELCSVGERNGHGTRAGVETTRWELEKSRLRLRITSRVLIGLESSQVCQRTTLPLCKASEQVII